jgi:hypothetical protein
VSHKLRRDRSEAPRQEAPNGSVSGDRAAAPERAAVSRRRWCRRHRTS